MSYQKAEAIPLDTTKRVVKIQGARNRQGALHEDIVQVLVFKDSLPDKLFGRIVKVIERYHKQKLVCKVHKYNQVLFCPLSDKYPIILNLPRLSQRLLEKRNRNGIRNELKSKDVVIFDHQYVFNDDIPQISNVIPHSVALNMLFVVRVLTWNPKYRFPLGLVIHALPQGFSAFHAERILMIEHEVKYDNENETFSPVSAEPVASENTEGEVGIRAFPDNALNLDDAISLTKKSDSCFNLAVHIVNTTKDIMMNDVIDEKARVCGLSVYGQRRVMNMLPSHIRSKLSLQPGQIGEVVSVIIGKVVLKENFFI